MPTSNALTARVATIGVMRKRTIARPLISPLTAPAATAAPIPSRVSESCPPGTIVIITAATEITPGALRSRPPCWITSVWPALGRP